MHMSAPHITPYILRFALVRALQVDYVRSILLSFLSKTATIYVGDSFLCVRAGLSETLLRKGTLCDGSYLFRHEKRCGRYLAFLLASTWQKIKMWF